MAHVYSVNSVSFRIAPGYNEKFLSELRHASLRTLLYWSGEVTAAGS